MTLPVYRMSSAMHCPKSLVAARLGYEPAVTTEQSKLAMKEGSRHECWVAEDVAGRLKLDLLDAGMCRECHDEFGDVRHGFHVEMATDELRLVGHLDRIVIGFGWIVEIKALGRYRFQSFAKNHFDNFLDYAGQLACYCEAHEKPGLFCVKNRDSGQVLVYDIPYGGVGTGLAGLDGQIELPVTWGQVYTNVSKAEYYTQRQELPPEEYEAKKCRWCNYKYLCVEEKPSDGPNVTSAVLVEAAEQWKQAKAMADEAEQLQETAKETFLQYAKAQKQERFRVGSLSISYRGQRTREYIHKKLAESLFGAEQVQKCTMKSKPYDDITIRVAKE